MLQIGDILLREEEVERARMIDAYDLNGPDHEKRELASVLLIDDLFGPSLLDRLAKQEDCEAWLQEVRARAGTLPYRSGWRGRRLYLTCHG